ncbi:hypothetical protein IID10_13275 [candidate division KSB1 bacterium]|nr:hypothetical protein [candidate division KSB1 bacterium]
MPHQNRVTPNGEFIATSSRGTLMGNRGRLHTPERKIVRSWQLKAWITCLLEFKERHRPIMPPNSWTELFFLDEVTAFAAGHRPCGECCRQDFRKFKELWMAANPNLVTGQSIKNIDEVLHNERVSKNKTKVFYHELLRNLPIGTMFMLPKIANQYFALGKNRVIKWSPQRYESYLSVPGEISVRVLTPRSVVMTFAQGYEPKFHESSFPL